MFKDYFKKVKKDFKNKKKIKDSLTFLLYFFLSFTLIYLFLAKSIFYKYINLFFGLFTSKILNLFNLSTTYAFDVFNQVTYITVPALEYPVAIVFLCTGILEFGLIFSAIVSTLGVSIKKKVRWVLISFIAVIFFNLLRIVLTVLIIIYFNLSVADFFHGFLFRLSLIVIVIGIYYLFLKNSF